MHMTIVIMTSKVQDQLSLAAFHSNVQQCKIALANGADINKVDHNGFSPLMRACYNQPTAEVVQMLLDAGADQNLIDRHDGQTALHIACRYGNFDIVPLLIAQGSDPQRKDVHGHSSVKLAAIFCFRGQVPRPNFLQHGSSLSMSST
jgi:ankyrin repeat protein